MLNILLVISTAGFLKINVVEFIISGSTEIGIYFHVREEIYSMNSFLPLTGNYKNKVDVYNIVQ